MAEGKLDLPDDLLVSSKPSDLIVSSKPSDHSPWNPKVESSGIDEDKSSGALHDEAKDQAASESSIPLSPQWLYTKPSETKMDIRGLTSVSLGNSNDPSQKDVWRLDGTEDKKDWRRIATENESRRWREEERETGLLSARRDRRKTDRRVDTVSIREPMENRVLPSPDRWHDSSNRNSGHEARRDSKWSSRWGPDDKEKESRTEKRTDVEKEKEDAHHDNQSSVVSNRSASERDSDARDKWRPRHRMEVHSTGSSYRAAPGFGVDRGRGNGSNSGFAVGRGRGNAIGRSSSTGTPVASHLYRSGSVIGKPNHKADAFCYPRGKLLDIYRQQKFDSSFADVPDYMEESEPLTQTAITEPLAFVAPDAEEEAVLTDIWKGKITSSGVLYNSFRKGRSNDNVSVGEDELIDGKPTVISSVAPEEIADCFQEAAGNGVFESGVDHNLWNHDSNINALDEKEVNLEGASKVAADGVTAAILESIIDRSAKEISTSFPADSELDIGNNGCRMNSALTKQLLSDDLENTTSFDDKPKLPGGTDSLFVLPSLDEDHISTMSNLVNKNDTKEREKSVPPEDLYFYYVDPHGQRQGPFLGADIIMWFEECYFGLDLPVRWADAPEGTPFQSLGDIMPQLKTRGGYPSSELEQSGALGGILEPGTPASSAPENTEPSVLRDHCEPLSDVTGLLSQHAQARMVEPENALHLPYSEGQSFHDFVAQDEEIVFPGRPGSSGYPTVQSSGNGHDPLAKSNGHPSLPNKLTEPGLPYQSDGKLHPFGLFWSELEASQARQTESIDVPISLGRTAPYGAMTEQASAVDKWSEVYRHDMLSGPNSFEEPSAARHLSLVEQEHNHFDLAEQLMSRQFQQQQLQQRNLLPHSRLNESLLEHVPGQNLIHHQTLANHPVPSIEHLLALQLQHQQLQQQQQQQRQMQLQQQQQQQFHQQQKLLQERQQAQARQMLLEQLLHSQMPDPVLSHSRVDPIRANNALDQVLLEQQLLHELQRSHHPQRHFVPAVEQFNQAKFGPTPQQDQQRDLFELLSRAQHGQMPSLEHQILQEQLQARQLPLGLRQRMNVEEERHIDSIWHGNENDQFLRNFAGNHRSHSSGISPLDFYQHQQRPLHEDQLSHLERSLSFQDRVRQGLFEPGSVPFERSLSMAAGASGMNMDVVNAMAHAHGLDMQELSARMQSSGQVLSGSHGHPHNPHQTMVPNQFHISPHVDAIEGHWSESSGPLANDWVESRMQQLHINAERQKWESDIKTAPEDPSLWMSDGLDDDKSRRLLMELLNQKAGHQPSDSLHMNDGIPFEKRPLSGLYSGSSSSDREVVLNNSFAIGSYSSNAGEQAEISPMEQIGNSGSNEKLLFRSESGTAFESNSSLLGMNEAAHAALKDSNFVDNSSINRDYLEVEGRMYGSKGQGVPKNSVNEIHNGIAEQTRLAAPGHGEVPVNALSRHSSLGVSGFYDEKLGPQNSYSEDIPINQVPALSKGPENILLRRPPVPRASSSQEGLSELITDTVVRGKGSSGVEGGNPVNQGASDMSSGKKDARFRRTSSCGDTDTSEPSFIDMLKSNTKKIPVPEAHSTAAGSESGDGAQGGKGGKKKGKKGRQIDPALLGFKVTSNRIMMGEIQRIED